MTVSNDTTVDRYTASVEQTVFPYTFRILAETDLTVTSNGVALTLNSDYSVSGVGEPTGGNVTLLWEDGAVGGELITILRSMPLTQLTDYVENDAFPAQTHEDALDRLTMMVHQLAEELDRALKFGTDSTNVDVSVATLNSEDFLQVNSLGNIVGNSTHVSTDGSLTGVDVTSTDATKDKVVSDLLAKGWEDYKDVSHMPLAGGVFTGIPRLKTYTVATLPAAATYVRGLIWVSDETGGPTMAVSDGTNWKRMNDYATVS